MFKEIGGETMRIKKKKYTWENRDEKCWEQRDKIK